MSSRYNHKLVEKKWQDVWVKENIFKTSLTVAGLDTLIAILAGLAIFPMIFAYGMEPQQGPGLVFKSLLAILFRMLCERV